jgi:hypothetical protein
MSCPSNCDAVDVFDIPSHRRGDTFKGFSFEILEDDETTPVDITGSSFFMQFRTAYNSPVAYEASTANNKIQIIDNKVVIMPFKVELTPNRYIYDIEWTDAAGVIKTVMEGTWVITKDISRP